MTGDAIKVLLVEDNLADARLVREALRDFVERHPLGQTFELVQAERLSSAFEQLSGGSVQVVLLDLALPDAHGIDTIFQVRSEYPDVPIVVLTGLSDEALAVRAVHAGAQDYLIKGEFDDKLLVRAMRYAIERQRLQTELRALSLIDDLTGLYNRRGFMTLAAQQVRLAIRTNKTLVVLAADVDDLKSINDTFGHQEGDLAIMRAAEILRKSLRQSDIVARVGGDEFSAVITDVAPESSGLVSERLASNLASDNAGQTRPYTLSFTAGMASLDPGTPRALEDLLKEADLALYEGKKRKNAGQTR